MRLICKADNAVFSVYTQVEHSLKTCWRNAETCVDYRVYVRQLKGFTETEWCACAEKLRDLGKCRTNAFGIFTVSGGWGFFQIPSPGFPELKVTFFQFVSLSKRQSIFARIENALQKEK